MDLLILDILEDARILCEKYTYTEDEILEINKALNEITKSIKMYRCSCCREYKTIQDFYVRPSGLRNYYCRECDKVYKHNYRRTKKELRKMGVHYED